jgi:glycine/D-amino acid oxidase-like deaminating enzyme
VTSLWEATASPAAARPPLPGDRDVDVAIVGGGYTGLWTARALLESDPTLRVAVLERTRVGFGASGRNGGWCSALLPMSVDTLAAVAGPADAVRMQRQMFATVAEVAAATRSDAIDCDLAVGGYVALARNRPQLQRLEAEVAAARRHGFGEDDLRMLGAQEARERVGASSVVGGTYTPHCAALHPLRLVRGLAAAVERRGAVIHESTAVQSVEPGRVGTDQGIVRADVIVLATEAYTVGLPGQRRRLLPIYSMMLATDPLPTAFWEQARLTARETFNDARHLIVYGQRTADDRLAFGGRGAPYHYGSRIRDRFDRHDRVHRALRRALDELFPYLGDISVTHRWGGPLGVPRDWFASVGFDRTTGIGWAGGYVGDGVAASNLAGRTIAALVAGKGDELTTLPWVQHRSPRWEPEPLRWLGVRAAARLTASLDRAEHRNGRTPRARSSLASRLTGHHRDPTGPSATEWNR